MDWLSGAWRWAKAVAKRSAAEREMDEELRFHLEMEIEKNIREGMMHPDGGRRAGPEHR